MKIWPFLPCNLFNEYGSFLFLMAKFVFFTFGTWQATLLTTVKKLLDFKHENDILILNEEIFYFFPLN
jgi:hypothetical protein